jgi:CopG family transcriptional regulator, nickel-responsive regulator
MQRFTMTMSDEFADEVGAFMLANGYNNRSEAMRDLARMGLDQVKSETSPTGQSLATLAYVFDHKTREIPKRLARSYHQHHDLSVATMHVHLDHDNCLEIAVLRGETTAVRQFSQSIIAERGVRHGRVTFVPVDVVEAEHSHHNGDATPHTHVHPKG